ncbi:MAG: tetratricopeptide repeat protein, partial [Candidatus Thorarchaeota archaeon]
QDRIVSISGGNPFVINAICDMRETTEISINDIENLRAETLDEVRLKTWRRLFSHAKDLLNLVDRAGLLPSFDKKAMNIVSPGLKTDQWERMIRLSFVKPRSNGSWVLHDLARDLVRAELGTQLASLVTDVSELLKNASAQDNDPALLGIALSVKALDSEENAITESKILIRRLIDEGHIKDALTIVDNLVFQSEIGVAIVLGLRGMVCEWLRRYAEAEYPLREAIRVLEQSAVAEIEQHQHSRGMFLYYLADVLHETGRYDEAEPEYVKAVDILRKLARSGKEDYSLALLECLNSFAYYYYRTTSVPEGLPYALEALELAKGLDSPMHFVRTLNVAAIMIGNTGNWEKQKEMYKEAIDLLRRNLKKSDTPFGRTLLAGILGNYSQCLQDYDEIEEIFKEVFELREASAEEFPQNQAFSKVQYAMHCRQSHKLRRATTYLKEALSFYENYAKEQPQASVAYLFLVRLLLTEVYILSDNLSMAQEILAKLEEFLPRDIGTTSSVGLFAALGIHGLMGLCYTLSHQLTEAQREFEISMETIDRMVIDSPEEVQLVVSTLNNYGVHLQRMGKFDDSEEVLNKARDLCESFITHWSSTAIASILQANLALIHHSRSEYVKADTLNSEVIETHEEFVKINENLALPFLTKSLHNSSVLLAALERNDEALGILQKTLLMKNKLVDEDPSAFRQSLATSLNNLGVILYRNGNQDEAVSNLEEAIEIRRELVGNNPDVHSLNLASSLQNLSIILYREGQSSKSQSCLKEGLKIREKYSSYAHDIIANFQNLTPDEILEKEIWSLETEPIYIVL